MLITSDLCQTYAILPLLLRRVLVLAWDSLARQNCDPMLLLAAGRMPTPSSRVLPQLFHLHQSGKKRYVNYEKQSHFIALYSGTSPYGESTHPKGPGVGWRRSDSYHLRGNFVTPLVQSPRGLSKE